VVGVKAAKSGAVNDWRRKWETTEDNNDIQSGSWPRWSIEGGLQLKEWRRPSRGPHTGVGNGDGERGDRGTGRRGRRLDVEPLGSGEGAAGG